MSQLSQAVTVGMNGFEELRNECADYAEVDRMERALRLRLVEEIKPLLKIVRNPITLDLRVDGLFPEAVKVSVGKDFSLKAVYRRRGTESVPRVSPEEAFLTLVQTVVARIEAEVALRRRREAARRRPRLRAVLKADKKRIPIFGRWKYHLVVFNMGGDALSVAVTTRCGGKEQAFEGSDIQTGDRVDYNLKDYGDAPQSEKVNVGVMCSDTLLSTYEGAVQLRESGGYRPIQLKKPHKTPA